MFHVCALSVANVLGLLRHVVSCSQHTVGDIEVTFVDRRPERIQNQASSACILNSFENSLLF